MTPRDRVFAALRGEMPDHMPMQIWNNKMLGGACDQQLLDMGVCVTIKSSVWQPFLAGVEEEHIQWQGEDGYWRTRTIYHTNAGDVTTVHALMPGTMWTEEPLFKEAKDFPAIEALVAARRYTPIFEAFQAAGDTYPGQSFARPGTIHSPLHEVMYNLMGVEEFCFAWADEPAQVLQLHEVVAADWERRVALLADSPAEYCIIDANTEIHVIGLDRYQQYYLPFIQRGCEILHARGKLVGAHLDGENRLLAPDIAQTDLDFIESFTPPPDCTFSITEARQAWPEKTLLLNFPSSVHLGGPEAVRARAREILREAAPGHRVIVGVLEDVPYRGVETIIPLMQCIAEEGRLPVTASGKEATTHA
jgi:hypothetical protein